VPSYHAVARRVIRRLLLLPQARRRY